MSYTHKKIPYHASCVQWDGSNTDIVLTILNDADTYAAKYGDAQIMVRFSKPAPGRHSIDTLAHGWWVVIGENGTVKCYTDATFRTKYQPIPSDNWKRYLDSLEPTARET